MATSEQKLSARAAIINPTSTSIGYVIDSGTSYQATLGNISKGIIVTNLDVTGLTASELVRLNSGGTALESAGVEVTDFVTLTGTQTLTNKTLTSPVLTTPQINDTSADHQYILGVSELAADRTITLPLLTGNDTFVFQDFTQTLTNKTLTSPDMTSPSVTSGDVNLATGLNIQVNSTDPWRTIFIAAGVWKPTTTSGCASVETIEAATNDIDYDVLAFDASTDENAYANIWMPDSWDGGAIQFRYIWTNAGGGSAETVVFELSGRSYGNDDAIDQAVGTPVEVSDTWIAQNDIHISSWSGDVTITGAGAGEWVHLELMRDVSEDNLTGDARLIGTQIRYRQATYTD